MDSFFWVSIMHRHSTSGTPIIQRWFVDWTDEEEGGGEQCEVNFKTGAGIVTTTTDGTTMTVPTVAGDLSSEGDTVMRVVYGETRGLFTQATATDKQPRYMQTQVYPGGTGANANQITACTCCLMFPKDYIQNMKYIGRARTDNRVAGDADAPYAQPVDERLNPEVCVLQADGTYYDASAL